MLKHVTCSFRKIYDFSQEHNIKICENMSKFGSKIECENRVGQTIQKKRRTHQQRSEPNGQGEKKGGRWVVYLLLVTRNTGHWVTESALSALRQALELQVTSEL